MYRAESDKPPWEVLRALTGHFDPSTVFTVIADSRTFQFWQQELQLCKNLLFLNLSHSGLGTLNVLSGLTRLRYLDISHNNIVRLDQINKLKSLETLKVSANNIRRLQQRFLHDRGRVLPRFIIQANGEVQTLSDLRDLSGLRSLTTLYLQKPGGREACPVCHHPEYKCRVLCLLPHEGSTKHSSTSPGAFGRLPVEQQQDEPSNNSCSDNPPSLKQHQRNGVKTDFSLNGPLLAKEADAPVARPTRLRILDGIRLSLSDWNEQADKIQRHIRLQKASARCLRDAVAEMCQVSVCPPHNTEKDPNKFLLCQQKIAALQAALASARETLEAIQKLKGRSH